jgi:hypothetical protein
VEKAMIIKPHPFEVHEGDDRFNPETWCKYCNCTLSEAPELHIDYGVDGDTGQYFVEDGNGKRVAEGFQYESEALAFIRASIPCS